MRHLENIRSVVRDLAEEAGSADPASFARSWHILMKGSIVAAAEGDPEAARRAVDGPPADRRVPLVRQRLTFRAEANCNRGSSSASAN